MIKLEKNEYRISETDGIWTVLYGLGGGLFTSKWARSERAAKAIVQRLNSGEPASLIGSGGR